MPRLRIVSQRLLPRVVSSLRGEAGAEIEETDDEANKAQGEITLAGLDKTMQSLGDYMNELVRAAEEVNEKMKGWNANLPETNDAKEEEQEKKDEDESESDLLELTGRLGTRMKCFQREVEATDESQKNIQCIAVPKKKEKAEKEIMCSFICGGLQV